MATAAEILKKKTKDAESVIRQVYGGIKGDWTKLLNALDGKPSKKKLARPGK